MKIRSNFEMDIDVEFSEPEKAKAFFIDGDWKNHFFTFGDLQEFTAALAFSFHATPDQWDRERKTWTRSPEGYGTFVKDDSEKWVNIEEAYEDIGRIVITYESELENCGTFEV